MANYLVIAAGSSIGQAVVHFLLSQGDTVFTTARDNSKIGPDALLNATDFDAVSDVFKQAGLIDGVVNCAGNTQRIVTYSSVVFFGRTTVVTLWL